MIDGTTEPILVVIGNPIAGNPAQFALERSLRSLKLDWRVLSFDVTPENVHAAIGGFAVTGIAGVLVARELAGQAGSWKTPSASADGRAVDCFFRDEEKEFSGEDQTQIWLNAQIDKFKAGRSIWLGSDQTDAPIQATAFEHFSAEVHDLATLITESSVIVLNVDSAAETELDREDWPEDDGRTLVIDLGVSPELSANFRNRGYLVIGEDEFRVGSLQLCIARWTGQTPSDDVVIDAIEEYLSV